MKVNLLITAILFLVCCIPEDDISKRNIRDIQAAIIKAKDVCKTDSIVWFENFLQKAEEDKANLAHNGQYIGFISIVQLQGESYFLTNFGLGSGGVAYYLIDCSGDHILESKGSLPTLEVLLKNAIYTSWD